MESYIPSGICAKKIQFEIKDGILEQVLFTKGCPGNLKGLARLAEGLPVDEVIEKLNGITCGKKNTSCPDQLAKALISWQQQQT